MPVLNPDNDPVMIEIARSVEEGMNDAYIKGVGHGLEYVRHIFAELREDGSPLSWPMVFEVCKPLEPELIRRLLDSRVIVDGCDCGAPEGPVS